MPYQTTTNEAVDTATAAEILGVSKSHLEKIRVFEPGAGPPTIRIGKCVRYPVGMLRDWMSEQVQ